MFPDQERWARADALLNAALDLVPEEIESFLDRECSGDAELRRLVESLLAAESRTDSVLDRNPALLATTLPDPGRQVRNSGEIDLCGRRLGAFQILGEIGRGGMAVVYRARRVTDGIVQDVAIKVLARSLASSDARARFRRERQILAASDHPGMARLLDGGETEEGLLYLVMELVEGERIDAYCDRHRLAVRERVRLFLEVGRTVADAHRRLIVHRDIKPSNILVSASGFPKLLDFGIAKLLEDESDHTRTGWLLTPAYAAPEQFSGGEITTATDVYQLGLLLYALLVGTPPYPVDGPPAEVLRHVCRTPPERPAVAAARAQPLDDDGATGSALRARSVSSPRQLRSQVAGDLEAILLKALRKEPERRYRSVEAMLDDLERYLEGRPVRARAGTIAYRLGKLADRHRAAVLSGIVGVLALVGWATSASWHATRLGEERDRANREAETATAVSSFLTELFVGADPTAGATGDLTAHDLLVRGSSRLAAGKIADPLVRARLEVAIGRVWYRLSRYDDAIPLLQRGAAGLEAAIGAAHRETAAARRFLIGAIHLAGRMDEAEALATTLLAEERQRGAPPWDLAEILDRLGEIAHTKGKLEVATQHLREAASLRESHHGRAAAAVSLDKLARVAVDQGDLAGAERLFEEVLGYYIDREGPDHPKVLVTKRRRANLLRRIGRLEEARSAYDNVIEQHRAVLGDGHPMTWIAVQEAMFVARDLGDLEGAWRLIDQARLGLLRTAGASHPMTLQAHADAAAVLIRRGELDAARAILLEAHRTLVAVLGDQAPMTISAELQFLALEARRGLDVLEQVESLAERAHTALGPTHAHTAAACHRAAVLTLERGDRDRATRWLRRALAGDYRSRLEHVGLLALAREDLAAEFGAWRERRTTRGVDDGSG